MKIKECNDGIRRFEMELSNEEIDIIYRALHDYSVMGKGPVQVDRLRAQFNSIRSKD